MSNILENFVKDKRVIVCGPAPHLENQNKGSWIDDHDVVVRVNQCYVPEHLFNDYGKKIDIMSHNFGTDWIPALKQESIEHKDQFDKLKMMICPLLYGTRVKEDNYMSWSEDHIGDVVRNAESINTNEIPFYWIGPKKYQQLYHEIGSQPYSGVLTIMMLLECNVKSLTVTGFDFYQTSNVYYEGFHNPMNGPLPTVGGGHGNAIQQARYIKGIYQSREDFFIDDKLKNIFENL